MPANHLTIPEILLQIKANFSKPADVARALQLNNTAAMRDVLRYAFDDIPWYRSDLPPFTLDGSPEGLAPTTIYSEVKRFYIFKQNYNLPVRRKDEILIQILESVNSKEVDLIKSLFTGTFSETYGITKDVVFQAFPNLFGSRFVSQ
jgi:hypothetical protein